MVRRRCGVRVPKPALFSENLLHMDLANNYTESNREFGEKLLEMDRSMWQPWQKDSNGWCNTFSILCVDPSDEVDKSYEHRIRLDVNSPHFKPLLNDPHANDMLQTWNAFENEQFHDELQFLQTQQLVMERNLNEFNKNHSWLGRIWHRRAHQRYQKQYCNLKEEIELFKRPENRDAFSRVHIPRQYFESVQQARERMVKE